MSDEALPAEVGSSAMLGLVARLREVPWEVADEGADEIERLATVAAESASHERALTAALAAAQMVNDRLHEALKHAALALAVQQDVIAGWGAYASAYFQQKHDLAGDIESARVSAVAAHDALKA